MKNHSLMRYFHFLLIYVSLVTYTSKLHRLKNTKIVSILDFLYKDKKSMKVFYIFMSKSFIMDNYLMDTNMG